jgi:hypothetical protein
MRTKSIAWLIVCAMGSAAAEVQAAGDACDGFGWDIGHERALFATKAEVLPAGMAPESAPTVLPDRLYEMSVTPQGQVKFPVPPGKKTPTDGAPAGLVHLRVASAGDYRISIDQAFWIDVVADHQLLPAKDFQGRHGCQAPHKIVLYSLPAGQDLMLQFSGGSGSRLKLTITPVAPSPR